jgi:zinc protease
MRARRLLSLLSIIAFSAMLAACDPRPNGSMGPNVGTARLANGLEIIVIPDFRADVVTHMLWYRVGSADEPIGKSGIAHFFEHLMFRGTENIAPGEFSKTVARLGGEDNAFTSYDFTAYFQRIHRDKLATMMQMEAERMQKLIIDEAIVAVERDVILEERSMRVDGNPSALLSERMRARLHANTPYGVPVIGWRDEIAKLNAADASAFYRRYYAPDNAILVVAGAVTRDEVVGLAETYYGPLRPADSPRAGLQAAEDLRVSDYDKIETLADARVRQPSWRRMYRLPAYSAATKRQLAALDIAAEILGSGTGRLYRQLVVAQQNAVGAGAYADTSRLLNGELVVYASLIPGADFDNVRQTVDAEIAKLQETPVSDEELARAKVQLVSSLIYARDSQQSMAQIFGRAAALGLTPAEVLAWSSEIEQVTKADIRDAARALLQPAHAITGHLPGTR